MKCFEFGGVRGESAHVDGRAICLRDPLEVRFGLLQVGCGTSSDDNVAGLGLGICSGDVLPDAFASSRDDNRIAVGKRDFRRIG